MNIKLPHMPYKFDSPEGRMEITVRRATTAGVADDRQAFAAAATFLQPGPLALKRIPLSASAPTYSGVMQTLIDGFKISPGGHDQGSVEFRVLTALTTATGVVILDE
ncbi:MAG: hypothetical protein RL091_105 [Verrucomicrobiota bacterium]|jgi:hypothetical protein